MPIVPFSPKPSTPPPRKLRAADEPWLLMAAAQMDAQNRLVEPHTINEGPEYDKWDEALRERGAIRIPKERDNPQEWMNQHEKMLQKEGIDREDRPDGSVILRKKALTS